MTFEWNHALIIFYAELSDRNIKFMGSFPSEISSEAKYFKFIDTLLVREKYQANECIEWNSQSL